MHPTLRLSLPVASAILLAACTPIDTTFGDAAKTDYSLQVINPDPKPVPADTLVMEGGSGTQGALAAERYRKGAVKQPQAQTTSSGSAGGSGSGGGSSPGPN